MPRFQPNNPGGPGGKRPGAGRKPAAVTAAYARKLKDLEPGAVTIFEKALDLATEGIDWGDRIRAAKIVYEQLHGLPEMRLKAQVDMTAKYYEKGVPLEDV